MAIKLYHSGLHHKYPVFFAYFVFRVPYGIPQLVLDLKSNTHFFYWIITEPILWVFYILLVVELARSVLAQYKGLYSTFRSAMTVGMFIAAAISLASLLPRLTPAVPQKSKYLGYVVAGERAVDLTLALFILLILLFISRYPIALNRNLRVHAVVYTVYFLGNTLSLILQVLFGMRLKNEFNILLMLATTGAMVAWLVLLSPKGEENIPTSRRISAEREQHLMTQLAAMNATLLKARR
jgi:hypothetical protein